jgi:hypothetical protein
MSDARPPRDDLMLVEFENLTAAAEAAFMDRIYTPVHDELPDPGVDFDRCVDGLLKKTIAEASAYPPDQRRSYFLDKARRHLASLQAAKAPETAIAAVERWRNTLLN